MIGKYRSSEKAQMSSEGNKRWPFEVQIEILQMLPICKTFFLKPVVVPDGVAKSALITPVITLLYKIQDLKFYSYAT